VAVAFNNCGPPTLPRWRYGLFRKEAIGATGWRTLSCRHGFCGRAKDLCGKDVAEGGGELWKLKDKAGVEGHFWDHMLRSKEHLGEFTKDKPQS